MPIKPLMTWVKSQKRWTAGYRGKMFSISPRKLGMPPTLEQSVLAANLWWEVKKQERDAELAAESHADDVATGKVKKLLDVAGVEELRDLVRRADAAKKLLAVYSAATAVGDRVTTGDDGITRPDSSPEYGAELIREGRGVASEVVAESLAEVEPVLGRDVGAGRTVGEQVDGWVGVLTASCRVGQLSAGRLASYRRQAGIFASWIGRGRSVESISAPKLEEYWAWLSGKVAEGEYSPDYAKGCLGTAKMLIRRLAELGVVPLPGNLGSRRLKITVPARKVSTFTVEEVGQLLAACDGYSERTKLYVLLMANCGMQQKDISDLGVDEVDVQAGTLKRKRSKTAGWENVPEVTYKLWPQTLELLVQFRSAAKLDNGRGVRRWLTTEKGTVLVQCWVEEGKDRRIDCVASSFFRVFGRLGWRKPVKDLRKTSSSLLETHETYGRYAQYFLGQAPQSIAERHYVKPSDEQFFLACDWLGRQFGLAE